MMDIQYQVVIFNVDRPSEPSQAREWLTNKSQYQNLKTGVIKDLRFGKNVYEVQSIRAFDLKGEEFGTRHILIIDVKKHSNANRD